MNPIEMLLQMIMSSGTTPPSGAIRALAPPDLNVEAGITTAPFSPQNGIDDAVTNDRIDQDAGKDQSDEQMLNSVHDEVFGTGRGKTRQLKKDDNAIDTDAIEQARLSYEDQGTNRGPTRRYINRIR